MKKENRQGRRGSACRRVQRKTSEARWQLLLPFMSAKHVTTRNTVAKACDKQAGDRHVAQGSEDVVDG